MARAFLTPFERTLLGGALLGELATLALCFALEPTPRSALAPVLGPWAGLLFGHAECTLASVSPLLSGMVTGLLLLSGLGLVLGRARPARPLALLAFVLALGAWCALAALSIVNLQS